MNWLRDNILKILIILGALIVVTVVIVILAKPKKEEEIVSGSKYGEIETKLQNAAINYVDDHKTFLPADTDNSTTIKLSTLQSNNYIGKLVAIEKSSVTCDGYVEIEKLYEDKNAYRYLPFINCGEYYTTQTISEYIINVETNDGTFNRTADDGLYKIGDDYVFRGEAVKNYIKLDNRLYRIISINKEGQLELISTDKTGKVSWDDRYNVERNKQEGINNFMKSRLHDTLISLYETEDGGYFSGKEKSYIVSHDFCIGKRSTADANIYSGAECSETTPLYVGLITANEHTRASIDPNCTGLFDAACTNYNYFNSLGPKTTGLYVTLTATSDNTFQVFRSSGGTAFTIKASASAVLYPVIYINTKTIYSTGTGTLEDPYIVR